uniref:Protein kinase domain-containing protein n=1 Tax=Chaetoceros debilis TaxID=122233 RepID=A0A7S3Q1R9_9STRA|mmetsp:Transcript_20431/g.30143  ORF Transcript_20431/g.30143 Transcript_20431/m.30143 type:complete len:1863 (-) Transcript_20431:22-5610(-)
MPLEKYRYKTRLHSLISKGPVPSRRAWQDSILTYLTQHCSVSDKEFEKKEKKTFFVSPLPVNVVPNKSLLDELRTEENGFIPLHLAAQCNCPSDIIAAFCHLFPQGATVPLKEGSLPLHLASKFPTGSANKKKSDPTASDNLKTIGILCEAYPMALVSRDKKGRTPLHILLENHASTRHAELIERFSRNVDEKVWRYEIEGAIEEDTEVVPMPTPTVVRKKMLDKQNNNQQITLFCPASALAVPDKINGAKPLHYAVKNGAPKEVVAALVKGYPASVAAVDKNGRTPLHWCFGASGEEVNISPNENVPMHHFHRSSNIVSILLQKDESGFYDPANMQDIHKTGKPHRTALHYAIELLTKNILDPAPAKDGVKAPSSCITLKTLQSVINSNRKALIAKDAFGQTPLHVIFRYVFEKNTEEYVKALHIAQTGAASVGQPIKPKTFSPPAVILDLLLKEVHEVDDDGYERTVSAAGLGDIRGLLPLHCAVLAVCPPSVLKKLIMAKPRSLTQLTKDISTEDIDFIHQHYDYVVLDDPLFISSFESSRTPIHMAFASPWSSKAQSEEVFRSLLHFDSSDVEQTKPLPRKTIKIDGSIALKMQDGNGDTPLHLAARNFVSLEMLKFVLKQDSELAMIANNAGDLPIHYLLDKQFLFVNADLAIAHGSKDNKPDAMDAETTAAFREKVRDLAKKQTIVTRLAKFDLCGAIFAPTNGWTSDDDEATISSTHDIMQKINLLAIATVGHSPSLRCTDSIYGLNILHILLAFHASPYPVIQKVLESYPDCAAVKSVKDGYTPLDIHCIRRTIPNEVRKEELDAYKAIKELIFVSGLFPLDILSQQTTGTLQNVRRDKDLLSSLEQQIIAEISKDNLLSFHWPGNHPIDPLHFKLGLLKGVDDADYLKTTEVRLSFVCSRAWTFFATFYNLSDPSDQYSSSVDRILEKLNFDETRYLTRIQISSGTFQNVQSLDWDESTLTIDHYANVYCKAIFHKYYYFAGLYDFTPTSGASILLHKSFNCENLLIHATRKEFQLNKYGDDSGNSSWMFDPTTDVRCRKDYNIKVTPVVFKFTTNRHTFERETKWREELAGKEGFDSIVPILSTFDERCVDGIPDKKYAADRLDTRFKEMPLRSDARGELGPQDIVNLIDYPYAIVAPLATEGNLQEIFNHSIMDEKSIQRCARDVASLLDKLHDEGLIHGSLTLRNILAFVEDDEETGERTELKVGGLTSLTPKDQTAFKLGAITPGGKCLFDSACLPPEMFTKLNSTELQQYNLYWQEVIALENVKIPVNVIKPRIDPTTHDSYVIKCYCTLDEETQMRMPKLPYELVAYDESVDIWSFGVFLFNLASKGESLFQPNFRNGNMTSIEVIAKWNPDTAAVVISQYVEDLATQDLLLHILMPKELRKELDMNAILSHPYFAESLQPEVRAILAEAKEERELLGEIRRRQLGIKTRVCDIAMETASLGRLSMATQMRLTSSATEVLREVFDPTFIFKENPFSHVLLPYKLAINKDGKLTPGTKMDVELAERVGRQMLMLCKVLCFAACYSETLSTKNKTFQDSVAIIIAMEDVDPMLVSGDILKAFHLNAVDYQEIAHQFVLIFKEQVTENPKTFTNDPMAPINKLVAKYVINVADTYTVINKAYLYLVDEYAGLPAVQLNGSKIYPHVFRDHVIDVVYKCLPYMHTCTSNAICAADGVKGLVKLIFEGAYPQSPPSWQVAFKGVPTLPNKKRMVTEATILHKVCHDLIPHDSPLALNGEAEMQFLSSLFIHIDFGRTYAGLRPITDNTATMWVTEASRKELEEESKQESLPERVYENFSKLKNKDVELVQVRKAEKVESNEKDQRIGQLEKALKKVTREAEMLREANFEGEV